jgi:hypothetical protein
MNDFFGNLDGLVLECLIHDRGPPATAHSSQHRTFSKKTQGIIAGTAIQPTGPRLSDLVAGIDRTTFAQ